MPPTGGVATTPDDEPTHGCALVAPGCWSPPLDPGDVMFGVPGVATGELGVVGAIGATVEGDPMHG